MEQDAFHLIYTCCAIMGTLLLPIGIGLVAVFREGAAEAAPHRETQAARTPVEGAEA